VTKTSSGVLAALLATAGPLAAWILVAHFR
jgi:hypothetical protein